MGILVRTYIQLNLENCGFLGLPGPGIQSQDERE